MSWTRTGHRTTAERFEVVEIERSGGMRNGKRVGMVLPFPSDLRERLTALYRERDEVDAARYASGQQIVRGQVWALGLRRLESGDEVYESYRVLSSAGIEFPAAVKATLEELPQDWRHICQIDADGVVRTASLKQRARSGR